MNFGTPNFLENITDLKAIGGGVGTITCLLGPNFPTIESMRFYWFDPDSMETPDDDEIVLPANRTLGTAGRFTKCDNSQMAADWNAVAPSLRRVDNKPTMFDGAYGSLTGAPSLFSGDYSDLTNKPSLFSGAYTDLSGKPSLFSGAYTDLTGKPSLFSGAYADLTGKPSLFSGAYTDLTGKPTLAAVATSGSYVDLTNKPTIQAIQRTRVQTNTSGVYTWTFPVAYGGGVTPIVSLTVEDATASTLWSYRITAISNTSVTIELGKQTAVTILGISVLGVAATPQAYVHLTAVAP